MINLVSLSLTANFSSVGKIIMTSLMPVFDLMLKSNRGCFDMKGKPMDADKLRALQAPVKERYKEYPEKAITPARAEAGL